MEIIDNELRDLQRMVEHRLDELSAELDRYKRREAALHSALHHATNDARECMQRISSLEQQIDVLRCTSALIRIQQQEHRATLEILQQDNLMLRRLWAQANDRMSAMECELSGMRAVLRRALADRARR